MKRDIKYTEALLFAKELGDKQQKFIKKHGLNKYKNFAEVSNFMSQNKDEWPTDERGFIDWELLEKDGHV